MWRMRDLIEMEEKWAISVNDLRKLRCVVGGLVEVKRMLGLATVSPVPGEVLEWVREHGCPMDCGKNR